MREGDGDLPVLLPGQVVSQETCLVMFFDNRAGCSGGAYVAALGCSRLLLPPADPTDLLQGYP
jgi:hypothetical protein